MHRESSASRPATYDGVTSKQWPQAGTDSRCRSLEDELKDPAGNQRSERTADDGSGVLGTTKPSRESNEPSPIRSNLVKRPIDASSAATARMNGLVATPV